MALMATVPPRPPPAAARRLPRETCTESETCLSRAFAGSWRVRMQRREREEALRSRREALVRRQVRGLDRRVRQGHRQGPARQAWHAGALSLGAHSVAFLEPVCRGDQEVPHL